VSGMIPQPKASSEESMSQLPGSAPAPAPRKRVWISWLQFSLLPPLCFLLAIAIGWEAMARSLHSMLVPGLGEIALEVKRVAVTEGAFFQIFLTLERIVLGSALAFVVSVVAGIAAGRNRLIEAFLRPGIVLGLTIPGLVWALLCVIWFGVNWKSPVVALGLGVAPALTVNVIQGVRAVDYSLIEMTHIFRIGPVQRIRHLWLPAMAPFLLSGLRLAFSLAWKVIVLVEIFGMSSGVGYQLNQEFSQQNVAGVLAWTIVFGAVMAVIEYGLIQTLERRITRWRRVATV
jgi:NitT/TauT family transport system permease protein